MRLYHEYSITIHYLKLKQSTLGLVPPGFSHFSESLAGEGRGCCDRIAYTKTHTCALHGTVHLLRLIHARTDSALPMTEIMTIASTPFSTTGDPARAKIRRPKTTASVPSIENLTKRLTAMTRRSRLRGYWSAADAATNAVKGKGGGISDAMASAHGAFFLTRAVT